MLMVIVITFNSCSIKLNGASIPANMKTINVQFFENNAPLVVPYLSQEFTEALKKRIREQTRLSITPNNADATMEGRITNYEIRPLTLTDSKQLTAGSSRLTITVSVKYTNNLNPKQSFEETFSKYKDFALNGASLQSLENQFIKDIDVMLTEDIFNRAFAQW